MNVLFISWTFYTSMISYKLKINKYSSIYVHWFQFHKLHRNTLKNVENMLRGRSINTTITWVNCDSMIRNSCGFSQERVSQINSSVYMKRRYSTSFSTPCFLSALEHFVTCTTFGENRKMLSWVMKRRNAHWLKDLAKLSPTNLSHTYD